MKHLLLLSVFIGCTMVSNAQANASYQFNGEQSVFTQNTGQVVDQDGQPVPDILAKASMPGLDLYLTKTGVTYILLQYEEDLTAKPHPVYTNDKKFKVKYSRVDIALTGAVINAEQMQLTGEAGWKSNYYKTADAKGQLAVAHFKSMTVQSVYPGIDWVWKFNTKGNPEYDFIVHPGADPSVIKMQYTYADLKQAGNNLLISTPIGSLTEGPLHASCSNNKVQIAYNLNAATKTVTFNATGYDKTKDLLIDPPLALNWSAQFGGSFLNGLRGVTADTSGGVYMVGFTTSSNFPFYNPHGGAYIDSTYNGQTDAIILKLDTNQNLKWATFFGGPGNDYGNSVCFSKFTDNIYVTGQAATGLPVVNGWYNHGGEDAFIATFSSSLALIYSSYYGGSDTDEALKIYTADSTLYVAGYTKSTNFGNFGSGTYQQNTVAGAEAFVMVFGLIRGNTGLLPLWSTKYGGSGNDYATAITADTLHNVVVAGYTTSGNLPLSHTGPAYYQPATGGGTDAFIAQFNAQRALVNSTYYGGSGNDYIFDVASGLGQSFEFTGSTGSANLPLVNMGGYGYFQNHLADSTADAFIVKCSNSVAIQWATYLGGNAADAGTGISTDAAGNIYVTGFTFSTNFPVQNQHNAFFQPTNHGNADGFVAQFSDLGVRNWCTYKGDSCYQYPNEIYFDKRFSKFYVAGQGLLACTGDTLGQSLPDTGQVHNGVSSIGFCWAFNGLNECSGFSADVTIRKRPCPNQCNGLATATVTGGVPPYSYKWATGDSTATNNNFCYNDHWIEVRDSLGCVANAYPEPQPLSLFPFSNGITCRGYSTKIYGNVSGGNGNPANFRYQWSTSPGVYSDSTFILVTDTGTYSLTVTDSTNCVATAVVRVGFNNIPPLGSIEIIRYPNCTGHGAIIKLGNPATNPQYPYGSITWFSNSGLRQGRGDTLYATANIMFDTVYRVVDSAYCYNGVTDPVIYSYQMEQPFNAISATFTPPTNCHVPDGYAGVTINPQTPATAIQPPYNPNVSQVRVYIDSFQVKYNWGVDWYGPNMATTASLNDMGAGIWDVQVSDSSGGCSTSFTDTFTVISPQVTPVVDSAYCNQPNGSANLTNVTDPNGGPYTYQWQYGNDSAVVTGLTAGNYPVTITDGSGCSTSLFVDIPASSTSPVVSLSTTGITCYPGSVTADVSGGTAPYQYNWAAGGGYSNQSTTSVQIPGTYYVIVKDTNGCADTVSANVIYNNSDTGVAYQVTSLYFPTCDSANGVIVLNAPDPSKIYWRYSPYASTISVGDTFNHFEIGHYLVAVDSGHCFNSQPRIYSFYGNFETYFQFDPPTGCNTHDGVLYIGNTQDLTYDFSFGWGNVANTTYNLHANGINYYKIVSIWSNGSETDTLIMQGDTIIKVNGLNPGIYYTKGSTYFIFCNEVKYDTVLPANPPLTAYYRIDTPTCGGASIQLTGVNNHLPGYTGDTTNTFLWSTGATTPSVHNLAPGTYTVTITGPNACPVIDTFTIHSSGGPPITVNASYPRLACHGDTTTLTVTATGGHPPYTGTGVFRKTAGTYHIVITDSLGCSVIDTVHITQPTQLTVSLSTTGITCSPGSVTALASGGSPLYMFQWSTSPGFGSPSSISVTDTGTYSVTVQDENYCTATATGYVAYFNAPPTIDSITTYQLPGCGLNNGVAFINVSDPSKVFWQLPDGTIIYGDTLRNAPASQDTQMIYITDISNCKNGEVLPIQYHFYLPSPRFLPDNQGRPSGCNTKDGHITIEPFLSVFGVIFVDIYIGNQYSQSIISKIINYAPITYQWSTGASYTYNSGYFQNGLDSLNPGTYSVTITDGACEYKDTIVLTPAHPPLAVNYSIKNPACSYETIGSIKFASEVNNYADINGDTTITYLWSNGATTTSVSNLAPGTYWVSITGPNACPVLDTFIITSPPALVQHDSINQPPCGGGNGTIIISATGGTSPYTGTGTFFKPPGNYILTVTDSNGCSANDSITVLPSTSQYSISITNTTTPILCNGGLSTISISAIGGINPYHGTGTYQKPAGNYVFTVTDSLGCSATDSLHITQPGILSVNNSVNPVLCYGGNATINLSCTGGTPPYTGTGSYTKPAGSYGFIITDANNCIATDSIVITQPTPLVLTDTITPLLCYGGSATVTIAATGGTVPYYGAGAIIKPAGSYTLIVSDQNGCFDSVSAVINQPVPIAIAIQLLDTAARCRDTVKVDISATGGAAPYTGTGTITYTQSGNYTITVTDANSCAADSVLHIRIDTCTGTETLMKEAGVMVYPNPAADKFYVRFPGPVTEPTDIRLFAVDGKSVALKTLAPGTDLTEIDCLDLASGVYILNTTAGNRNYYFKVVVTR